MEANTKLELLTEKELNDFIEILAKEKERRSRAEDLKVITNLSKNLNDFIVRMPDQNIYIEVWCEECESNIEIDVTEYFVDIATKLDNLR